MLIDRRDHVINLCEMKYSLLEFTITKDYDNKLREKISDFQNVSKTKRAKHLTLVTTYGLEKNMYSGHIQSVITAEDLFQPEE